MNIKDSGRVKKQNTQEKAGALRKEMRAEEALAGTLIINQFYEKLGLQSPSDLEEIDYRALREEAFEERFQRNIL